MAADSCIGYSVIPETQILLTTTIITIRTTARHTTILTTMIRVAGIMVDLAAATTVGLTAEAGMAVGIINPTIQWLR